MPASDCPFCHPDAARVFHAGELVLGLWDAFPVSEGHALLVTKRHVASLFEATPEERRELFDAVSMAKQQIESSRRPAGFNVGVNVGEAAGQTVPHLHVHVIPRYPGDVPNPRGGVRHVIPARADYLAKTQASPSYEIPNEGQLPVADALAGLGIVNRGEPSLVTGGDAPLLPRLLDDLDTAHEVDICVAFVTAKGVEAIEHALRDVLRRRGQIRIITGDLQDFSDPAALRKLVDLAELYPERVTVRVFETKRAVPFHPKAYLFAGRKGRAGYIGSSNLTQTALSTSVEWNYRIAPRRDPQGLREALVAFEKLLEHPAVRDLTNEWVDTYEKRRKPLPKHKTEPEPDTLEPAEPAKAHEIQEEALKALSISREQGHQAGLVVLATGLGKTWLSAFDSVDFNRVLFVAHREEILSQAMMTYRRIRPDASFGMYTGAEKQPDARILFASIQTLSQSHHLSRFSPTHFDYIVVDEFHHAAARTYRELLDHFEPQFLLGLTATPERTDGGDLLALCHENLVYRCDLFEGIQRGRLSPFAYYGVPDNVDYQPIPWRSGKFNSEELTAAVATQARADNAYEQHQKHAGQRTIAFCVSQRHADFMAAHFEEKGLRTASVHSGDTSAPRGQSLTALREGRLGVLFAVDMFNEGVDIPEIDTVLMLRPTESRILWLQQLGRGLRKAEGKERLTVIDYIGNHRSFLLRPQLLLELLGRASDDKAVRVMVAALSKGEPLHDLPERCSITYDLEAVELLQSQLRSHKGEPALRDYYETFRDRHERRPTALEAYHDGVDFKLARDLYGSWVGFVRAMGDLDTPSFGPEANAFLDHLDTTGITRSYKLVVLRALLQLNALPGTATLEDLTQQFARIARRDPRLRDDMSADLDDAKKLASELKKNPIKAWTGDFKKSGDKAFFAFQNQQLSSTFDVAEEQRGSFADLVRELIDWRLAGYLERKTTSGQVFDPNGAPIDAHFSLQRTDAGVILTIASRGGKAGSKDQRNTEYGKGFTVLLERLNAAGIRIQDAVVDSSKLRNELPHDARRLQGHGLPDYPIAVDDPKALRKRMSKAMAAVGRAPGAKGGGNGTRRVSLYLGELDARLDQLMQLLALG